MAASEGECRLIGLTSISRQTVFIISKLDIWPLIGSHWTPNDIEIHWRQSKLSMLLSSTLMRTSTISSRSWYSFGLNAFLLCPSSSPFGIWCLMREQLWVSECHCRAALSDLIQQCDVQLSPLYRTAGQCTIQMCVQVALAANWHFANKASEKEAGTHMHILYRFRDNNALMHSCDTKHAPIAWL